MNWCIQDRIAAFDGTSLIDVYSDKDRGFGGYCDIAPPKCSSESQSCKIKIPEPPFWTVSNAVSFSFPELSSPESDIGTKYKWKICTWNEICITEWIDYEGKDLIESARATDPETGEELIIAQLVHLVDTTLPSGVSLVSGQNYRIKVLAYNDAGVLNGIEISSDDVTVDSSPPLLPLGKAVYNAQYFNNMPVQVSLNGMGVSWDEFEDLESSIKSYVYQIFEYNDGEASDTYVGPAQTAPVTVENTKQDVYVTKLSLTPGKKYFARVTATNEAGLKTSK